MTTADEYRHHAAECLEAARATASSEIRAALLSMAQRYEDSAANVERNVDLRLRRPGAE